METKLTKRQREILQRLDDLAARFPSNTYGFNPSAFGSSAVARAMEPRGWVRVSRITDFHFRYAITDAGRAVLPPPPALS